jgi:ribonuclease R
MADDRFRALADAAGLTPDFAPEVVAEVDAYLASPGIDDPALTDWTGVPFVTIDGPGTRDLDQAVHVEPVGDGFRLRYAIADASYYVRPGTALFDEALRRGASFYLPGFSVPMLPRPLSEGLVSLGPDVDRRALVFDVALDAHGTVTAFELVRARMRSRARLTFEEVQAHVDGAAVVPVDGDLRAIARVGLLRATHADRAAMVRYRRVETSVRLGADGELVLGSAPRTAIELANEQISILCNALGARYLLGGSEELVQPIYRVHAPPDEAKVAAFERLVAAVAHQRGLPDDPWVYRRAASIGLAGYLEHLPTAGPLGRVARALHRQAMMLNGRSSFDGEPRGHFGVGELVYSRFTAPMREMVGVQCHAQAIDRLAGSSGRTRQQDLEIRARVIEAGNRAKDTQRKLDREIGALIVAAVLTPDLALPLADRPLRTATVVGLASSKIFAVLDDPPIDVRASLFAQGKALGGAWLDVVDEGSRLVRRDGDAAVCRLGDAVQLRAVAPDAVIVVA